MKRRPRAVQFGASARIVSVTSSRAHHATVPAHLSSRPAAESVSVRQPTDSLSRYLSAAHGHFSVSGDAIGLSDPHISDSVLFLGGIVWIFLIGGGVALLLSELRKARRRR